MFNFLNVAVDNVQEAFYNIMLTIDSVVYWIFGQLYILFQDIASVNFISEEIYSTLTDSIYTIVGIIALFLITYTLLLKVFNPDGKQKLNGFSVVKNVIVAFAVIILTPVIFNILFGLQEAIITNNVIPNLLLGIETSGSGEEVGPGVESEPERIPVNIAGGYACTDDATNYFETATEDSQGNSGDLKIYDTLEDAEAHCGKDGVFSTELDKDAKAKMTANNMALTAFTAFYHPINGSQAVVEGAKELYTGEGAGDWLVSSACLLDQGIISFGALGLAEIALKTVVGSDLFCLLVPSEVYSWDIAIQAYQASGEFSVFYPLNEAVANGEVRYLFIISTIAGCVLVYLMFSFTFDIVQRLFKLMFLQLIAPLPALLSILPSNESVLKNWGKKIIAVYIELFIRIGLMAAAVLIISNVGSIFEFMGDLGFIADILVIFGIFAFVKIFPKLFSEVTGIKSGDLKIGIKDKLAETHMFAGGSAIGGGITSAVKGAVTGKKGWGKFKDSVSGLGSGAVRGAKAGWGAKNVADMRKATTTAVKGVDKAKSVKKDIAARYASKYSEEQKGITKLSNNAFTRNLQGKFDDFSYDVAKWSGSRANFEKLQKEVKLQENFVENVGKYTKNNETAGKRDLFYNSTNLMESVTGGSITDISMSGLKMMLETTEDMTFKLEEQRDASGRVMKDAYGNSIMGPMTVHDAKGGKVEIHNERELNQYKSNLKAEVEQIERDYNKFINRTIATEDGIAKLVMAATGKKYNVSDPSENAKAVVEFKDQGAIRILNEATTNFKVIKDITLENASKYNKMYESINSNASDNSKKVVNVGGTFDYLDSSNNMHTVGEYDNLDNLNSGMQDLINKNRAELSRLEREDKVRNSEKKSDK